MMNKKSITYSLIALIASGAIAACSNPDNQANANQNQAQAPTQTASPTQTGTNQSSEVDRAFIEMMVPHHQSANEMARIALERSKNPEVRQISQKIINEQTREIQQMQTWYKQWYGTDIPTMGGNMGNMQMSNQMGQGMMMSMQQQDNMNQSMIQSLRTAPNVDREFLRQMTRHHQMATMMAGMVVNTAVHPETRELAQNIIRSQNEEIAQMQQILQQLAQK